jgi:TRAP-type C4-dicarboxylate transport system permease small subunit
MDNLKKLFTLIGNLLTWTEEAFLCLLLVAMILLACVQIFLRTFYSSGILWADPLLRYMATWSSGSAFLVLQLPQNNPNTSALISSPT